MPILLAGTIEIVHIEQGSALDKFYCIYERIFSDICPLLSVPNFSIIDSAQIAARAPVYALKKVHMQAIFLRYAKVFQLESFL
jgi:hypothetical protein